MTKLTDDPRLTAYALGELPVNEVKEFEMELEKDKALQAEVESIQKQAGLLKEELKTESAPRLKTEQREEVIEASKGFNWKGLFFRAGFSSFVTAMLVVLIVYKTQESPMNDSQVAKNVLAEPELQEEDQFIAKEEKAVVSHDVAAPAKSRQGRGEKLKAKRLSAPRAMEMASSFGLQKGGGHLGNSFMSTPMPQANTESYAEAKTNEFLRVLDKPLSTFSIDVDTASYSNMRRFVNNGTVPPKDSVKVEEFINYFDYKYEAPTKGETPFAVNLEMADSPWNEGYKLVRVGLKAKEIALNSRPNSNLVFLLDVSGSMNSPNKLPLLKESLKMLLRKLDERDRVAMVVYAGASGLVLPSTAANKRTEILSALNKLNAGGSTNGGAGIELAYKTALENFIPGGINRVILATDGDFNVGTTGRAGLLDLIKEKSKSKVFLTVLGLGMGNYKDDTLETLAQNGNGNYAYIDNMNEAKKVLNEDLSGTLMTIAKDVKIQVEFNPSKVSAYRLVGYENRMLKAKDFNDDKKDAGEIGAGHRVTAFYEIVPTGVEFKGSSIDKLKYQVAKAKKVSSPKLVVSEEILNIKLRYKEPEGDKSKKIEVPLKDQSQEFSKASVDFRFAIAVATYAQLLKGDDRVGSLKYSDVISMAKKAKGEDKYQYREEFIELVELVNQSKK
ncbi:MAG: Ca-activated chloride channel family protein [Bacteriovoracaceae bacterium]|jgi:Ca-activated chloride channel family protein